MSNSSNAIVGRHRSHLSTALQNAFTASHSFIYRLTKGAIGGRILNSPVLLLTTEGRKTGKRRTIPLLYLADGNDVVVVASSGESAIHPAWWLNLQHKPEAQVQIGGERKRVRAEQADAERKRRLWPLLTRMYPGYEQYQRRANRDIPVIILRSIE